jgi:hypothetical protein
MFATKPSDSAFNEKEGGMKKRSLTGIITGTEVPPSQAGVAVGIFLGNGGIEQ